MLTILMSIVIYIAWYGSAAVANVASASLLFPILLGIYRATFGIAKGQRCKIQVKRRAVVVVGGDFARSPRMQYHAVSLAKTNRFSEVRLVGLSQGNRCCEDIEELVKARLVSKKGLLPPPKVPRSIRKQWLLSTLYRVAYFLIGFSLALWQSMVPSVEPVAVSGKDEKSRTLVLGFVVCDLILVQTPPAVPFLPILQLLLGLYQLVSLVVITKIVGLTLGSISPNVAKLVDGYRHPRQGRKAVLNKGKKGNKKNEDRSSAPESYRPALVTDWHNFGFSLLEIDRRPGPVVNLYRWFEQHMCAGDENFTVSQAMQYVLCKDKHRLDREMPHGNRLPHSKLDFGVSTDAVTVVHDTAPSFFKPDVSREEFLRYTKDDITPPKWFRDGARGTVFVSATSWTADDDYSLVVNAFKKLDDALAKTSPSLPVWLVVTGKGATREVFEQQVKEAYFSDRVTVDTVYFQQFANYARMLGVADVGISVHRSSSGLDLPMKVVDMFGCGLPTIALDYAALSELVDSKTGWIFDDESSLFAILSQIGLGLDSGFNEISEKHRAVTSRYGGCDWDREWTSMAWPVLESLMPS